jgi:hypothetical protein
MPSPLCISEISTRCLAAVARCFKNGNSPQSVEIMKAEVREVAREVARWRLSGEAKARIFLRPMEEVLVNQYGAHNGRRLYWDFFDAFWLQSWSMIPLETDSKAEPGIEHRATG